MKFTIEMVNEYLTIVNDENPIHRSIVPGQLICEKVFSELNVNWMNYKIKYLKPINIDEERGVKEMHVEIDKNIILFLN